MATGRLLPALLIALVAGQSALAVIPFPRVNPADPSSTPYRISSAFGPRMTSKTGFDIHEAIDFAGPPKENDPVFALEGGALREVRFTSSTILIVSVAGEYDASGKKTLEVQVKRHGRYSGVPIAEVMESVSETPAGEIVSGTILSNLHVECSER